MLKLLGMIVLALIGMGVLASLCTSETNTSDSSRPTRTPTPTLTWEQWQEKAVEIPYEDLFRYAEQHKGETVFYRGKVIQVNEERGDFQMRVNVTKGDYMWDDTVFLRYNDAPVRILEDDIIAFVGRMNGTFTYKAVLGNEVTIPDITVITLIIKDENDKDSPSFDW